MAIQKEIELENGMVLNYHRITSLNKITNRSIIIEVNSYINELQREKEKLWYDDERERAKPMNVIVEATYIELPYEEEFDIKDAYEYLKNTEDFKNCKNV